MSSPDGDVRVKVEVGEEENCDEDWKPPGPEAATAESSGVHEDEITRVSYSLARADGQRVEEVHGKDERSFAEDRMSPPRPRAQYSSQWFEENARTIQNIYNRYHTDIKKGRVLITTQKSYLTAILEKQENGTNIPVFLVLDAPKLESTRYNSVKRFFQDFMAMVTYVSGAETLEERQSGFASLLYGLTRRRINTPGRVFMEIERWLWFIAREPLLDLTSPFDYELHLHRCDKYLGFLRKQAAKAGFGILYVATSCYHPHNTLWRRNLLDGLRALPVGSKEAKTVEWSLNRSLEEFIPGCSQLLGGVGEGRKEPLHVSHHQVVVEREESVTTGEHLSVGNMEELQDIKPDPAQLHDLEVKDEFSVEEGPSGGEGQAGASWQDSSGSEGDAVCAKESLQAAGNEHATDVSEDPSSVGKTDKGCQESSRQSHVAFADVPCGNKHPPMMPVKEEVIESQDLVKPNIDLLGQTEEGNKSAESAAKLDCAVKRRSDDGSDLDGCSPQKKSSSDINLELRDQLVDLTDRMLSVQHAFGGEKLSFSTLKDHAGRLSVLTDIGQIKDALGSLYKDRCLDRIRQALYSYLDYNIFSLDSNEKEDIERCVEDLQTIRQQLGMIP